MSFKGVFLTVMFFLVGIILGGIVTIVTMPSVQQVNEMASAENPDKSSEPAGDEDIASEEIDGVVPPVEEKHAISCKVGDKAPDFSLPNANGEKRTLSEMLKNGPVILSFYRGGWCPFCNDQLYAYQQILPEFEELGAQLVAVSPETPESEQDTISKKSLTFEVLSDENNQVARAYDLLWVVPEADRAKLAEWIKSETGKTLAEINGVDNYELPIPATFVIAQDGTIVYIFRDEDYKKRAKNEDIIAALKSLAKHDDKAMQDE